MLDKEIECRVSRPPTKIGDLLFQEKNDNADAISRLGLWAKSVFLNYLDKEKKLHTFF